MSTNPYQAPAALLDDMELDRAPAGRATRLGAAIVDSLIFLAAWMVGAVAGRVEPQALFGLSQTGMMIYLLLALGIFALNLYLLHQHGQSIGKRLLSIKIVRTDGARAGLGRIFSLRILVPNIIYMVPILGALFALVDALFIFRDDRRCIHDLMADTQVIAA